MTTTQETAEHHHVFAVQDWGGSQEYLRGFDERLTRPEAERLAADMAEADTAYLGGPVTGTDVDVYEQAKQRFGDRWPELISGNVCPGWEGIWIVGCGEPCRFGERFYSNPETWGEPFWTPPSPAAPESRHLHLVP